MSTRKRRNSDLSDNQGNTTKRARLLSDLWRSQEETPELSSARGLDLSSQVKGIIGEGKYKYLVDWEDDLFTGEEYQADWVRMVHQILCALP